MKPKYVKISFNTSCFLDNCIKEDVENSLDFKENKSSVINKILLKYYKKKIKDKN